jgi:hypothetical protein
MVHNPNCSNSYKSDDSDCCKECKEYYCVTKQDCEWIKCPVSEKWMLENCTSLSKTCLDFGYSIRSVWLEILGNLQRNTKESRGDTEYILLYLMTVFNYKFIILYCLILGASFTTHMPKTPCVIFIVVSKRI